MANSVVQFVVGLSVMAQALLLAPDSLEPMSARTVAALAGCALQILALLWVLARTPAPVPFRAIDVFVGLALALLTIQSSVSSFGAVAFERWLQGFLAVQVYVVGRWMGARDSWRFLRGLSLATVGSLIVTGAILYGAFDRPTGHRLGERATAASLVSLLGNPDVLAAWLLVVGPMAASGAHGPIVGALTLCALGWTLSRGAIAALAVTALLVAGLRRPSWGLPHPSRRWVIAAAVLVCAGWLATGPEGRAKLTSTATAGQRIYFWQVALGAVVEEPLWGHGPGSFPAVYFRARSRGGDAASYPLSNSWAHDLPLQVASESGLPGLAVLGLILGGLAVPLARALTTSGLPGPAKGLALGLVACGIHSLISHSLFVLPITLLVAFLSGTMVVADPRPAPWVVGRAGLLALGLVAVLADVLIFPSTLAKHQALHRAGLMERTLRSGSQPPVDEARRILTQPELPASARYVAAAIAGEDDRARGRPPLGGVASMLMIEAEAPWHGHLLFNRGRLLLDLERPTSARNVLEFEVRREPGVLDSRLLLGECLYLAGDLEGARHQVEAARRLAPDGTEAARRVESIARALPTTGTPVRR